jgi:hypothetical protein
MKNNEWKRCMLSMQDSIDNRIGTTRIKPDLPSLSSKQSFINGVNKPFMGLFLLLCYLYDTCFDSTTDINEKLIKIKWKIRCGIGAEGDDSSAYPRFTLRSRIIYCKPGNNRKRLRLLLMMW